MPRLILIDHSLKRLDGHHFDYDRHILAAARQRGWTTTLATHRRLKAAAPELQPGVHLPVFGCSTYSRFVVAKTSQWWRLFSDRTMGTARAPGRSWAGRWQRRQFIQGRARHVRRFIAGCRTLFARIGHQAEDLVFLHTVSELDLLGLVQFLATASTPPQDWHVQFHHELVQQDLQDAEVYQSCVTWIRHQLQQALRKASGHHLRIYTSTEPLRWQYEQLGIGEVQALAYPVNPALQSSTEGDSRSIPVDDAAGPPKAVPPAVAPVTVHGPSTRRSFGAPRPLRIVCAGGPREEKGQPALKGIAKQVLQDLPAGAVCFLAQTRREALGLRRLAIWRQAATPSIVPPQGQVGWYDLPHPLAAEDYVRLIRSADIGLLIYDRHRYAARRAGVLGEFLAAGVPVIVPSACWLADQLADALHAHAERQLAEVAEVCPGTRQDDRGKWAVTMHVPEDCRDLILTWRQSDVDRSFLHVSWVVTQYDPQGAVLRDDWILVSSRPGAEESHHLMRLAAETCRVHCTCLPAQGAEPPRIEHVQISILRPAASPGGRPLGVVGLAVAGANDAVAAIREIHTHYAHYRQTAEAFSDGWYRRHDPQRTIQQLVQRSRYAARTG